MTEDEKKQIVADRDEERRNVLGDVVNHCPFGCATGDLDEYGYCPHLVGFTNDGKTIETIRPITRRLFGTKEYFETGDKMVSCKHLDHKRPGDRIVNPTRTVIDKGVATTVSAWVSSRVYREVKTDQEPPVETTETKKKLAKAS